MEELMRHIANPGTAEAFEFSIKMMESKTRFGPTLEDRNKAEKIRMREDVIDRQVERRNEKAYINAANKAYQCLGHTCKYWSYYSKTTTGFISSHNGTSTVLEHTYYIHYYSPAFSPEDTIDISHGSEFRNPMATVPRAEHPRVFAQHAIEIFREAAIVQRYRALNTEPLYGEENIVKRSDYEVLARAKQLDEYVMQLVNTDQAKDAWTSVRALCVEIGECAANDIFTRRFSQCTCQKKAPPATVRPKIPGVTYLSWRPDTNGCAYYHGSFKPVARARPPPTLETVSAVGEMFAAMPTFGSLPAADDAPPAPVSPPPPNAIANLGLLKDNWEEWLDENSPEVSK
jgi:hypothetical protein